MHGHRIFILDGHAIYRQGIETCLRALPAVEWATGADTAAEAWEGADLRLADLVLVDVSAPDGRDFIAQVRDVLAVPVIACSAECEEETVLAAVEAGATGFLAKDTITPENLSATLQAALSGAGVMSPELLGKLLAGISRVSRDVLRPRGLSLSRLTAREQQVLRLIAQGHATREVALELSYSERTVKNVLHDVVTKLGVRSRSHAVAYAVRHGLI
jgi:DNA-binding NarL/FixJ family response regulator